MENEVMYLERIWTHNQEDIILDRLKNLKGIHYQVYHAINLILTLDKDGETDELDKLFVNVNSDLTLYLNTNRIGIRDGKSKLQKIDEVIQINLSIVSLFLFNKNGDFYIINNNGVYMFKKIEGVEESMEDKIKCILSKTTTCESGIRRDKVKELNILLTEHICRNPIGDPNLPYVVAVNKSYYPSIQRLDNLKEAIEYLASELNDVEYYEIPDDDWFFYMLPLNSGIAISWGNVKPDDKEEND